MKYAATKGLRLCVKWIRLWYEVVKSKSELVSNRDNDSGALVARKGTAPLVSCSVKTKEGGHEWNVDGFRGIIIGSLRARSMLVTLAKCFHSPK